MYLGIDLGTSSVKAIIINEEQNIVAQATCELTVQRPQALWSEQDPLQWWQAVNHAVLEIKKNSPEILASIKAIGLSGQQHGATLLDKTGNVLRPAILWNDGRAEAQCEQLAQVVPNYAEITGNQIMPGFTAPKLLWVAQHEPEIFAQVDKVLLPKDYLRYRMSGVFASDMSDASGTSWLNVRERRWSEEMLIATSLTEQNMPELFEGSAATATVLPEIAAQWGIPKTTIIAGGAGDNAAAAMSINVISAGDAFISLGTSGTYFVADNNYHANAAGAVHTFCHCLPHLWHQMNCHLSAASAVSWWDRASGVNNVADLITQAEQHAYLNTSVLFLPYLSGERSPWVNPRAQGVFFGLNHDTTTAQLTEAVLEGVALNFAVGQDAMLAAGTTIGQVAVVGGGARSLYWGKILATALNRTLVYYENAEVGAAFGAARLGMLAMTNAQASSIFTAPTVKTTVEPDSSKVELFIAKKAKFKQLYQHLTEVFTM